MANYVSETNDEEIDVTVYMGACNNAQVMFHMVPDDEPEPEITTN